MKKHVIIKFSESIVLKKWGTLDRKFVLSLAITTEPQHNPERHFCTIYLADLLVSGKIFKPFHL